MPLQKIGDSFSNQHKVNSVLDLHILDGKKIATTKDERLAELEMQLK